MVIAILPVESLDHPTVDVQDGGGELDDGSVVTPLEVASSQVVEAAKPQPPGLSLNFRGLRAVLSNLWHIVMYYFLLLF